MTVGKALLFILLGVLVAVSIFCIVIAIGASVNEITFFEQISSWFGSGSTIANGSEQYASSSALFKAVTL